jgi:hypothetical protein
MSGGKLVPPEDRGDRQRSWLLVRLEPAAQKVLSFWGSVIASTVKKIVVLAVSTILGIGAVTGALAVEGILQVALIVVSLVSIGASIVVVASSRVVRSQLMQQNRVEELETDNAGLRETNALLVEAHALSEQLRELAETDRDKARGEVERSERFAAIGHDLGRGVAYLFDHPDARPPAAAFIDGRLLSAAGAAIAHADAGAGAPRPRVELALVMRDSLGYKVVNAGEGQSCMVHGTRWLDPDRSLDDVAERKARSEFHPDGHRVFHVHGDLSLVALSSVPLGPAALSFLEQHVDQINLTIKTLASLGME